MRKARKTIACFISGLIVLLSLSACNYDGYKGEHTDLYSVAVNNIFGVFGYLSNGEVLYDPEIHVIETDDFGRTLFFYNEFYTYSSKNEIDYGMAFVIMQFSTNGFAYYYEDECYLPYFDTTSEWDVISEKIDADYLEQLKEANDWNKELNIDRCKEIKITNKKPDGELQPSDSDFDKIIYPFEVKNGYSGEDKSFCRFSVYCSKDSYDRELHFVYGSTINDAENDGKKVDIYKYAIILNADGSCSDNGIARISNIEDSLAIINELKQNNNWNSAG